MDPRPDLEAIFQTFGVAATVTPYGGAPIVTTVIVSGGGGGADDPRGLNAVPEHLRRLTVRRSVLDAAGLAPHSMIAVGATTYAVDATEYEDDEIVRVVVRP